MDGATSRATVSRQADPTAETRAQDPGAAPNPAAAVSVEAMRVEKGTCYAMFAYDVGLSINLDEAERRIQVAKQRETLRHKRRAPRHFEYRPAPLRVTMSAESISVGETATEPNVDFVVYDFGAVSVTYRIPIQGPFGGLFRLSNELYDNPRLLTDSRRGVERLLEMIAPAVNRPQVADWVEDYLIFQVGSLTPPQAPHRLVADHALVLAQMLRAESEPLSPEVVADAIACRISFAASDVTVIDWNAAFLLDTDPEDVLAILEYANVELLEMRYLDDQLDGALERSYEAFSRQAWGRTFPLRSRAADLRRVAELQLDSAVLFEGVNNAVKLLGDQYLARVYRLAVQRLHLEEWDANIIRKLNTLESIYKKISDQQNTRRLEALEWIIIILIAVSIVISLLPGGSH